MLCFSAVRRLCPPVPGQVGTHPLVGRRGEWSSCGVDALVPVGVAASLRRCFALIDSSALEQTRDETETDAQAHLDSLLELGLSSTVSTVLTQCSSDIYQVQPPPTHTCSGLPQVCLSCGRRSQREPASLIWDLLRVSPGVPLSAAVSLCRWPCRRSTASPPAAPLRPACPAGWWLTCAELQPR